MSVGEPETKVDIPMEASASMAEPSKEALEIDPKADLSHPPSLAKDSAGQAKFGLKHEGAATPALVAILPSSLGTKPVSIQCPHCNTRVVTHVNYEVGSLSWLMFAVTMICGLWCGCCLIPFMVDGLKDAVHICPECGKYIGLVKRI